MIRAILVASMIAGTCGAAAGQTVTCLERNVVGELYGRVQIKREGDVRTFTDWTIADGREREPSSMNIPASSVLQFKPSDWTERDDDYDWEQINLDRSGNPWFLIVDYGVPLMIYGGYAKGMEDPLVRFTGDDCTVSD